MATNILNLGRVVGFSPTVTIEENTSESYKLKITTKDGFFVTPNLRGEGSHKVGSYYIQFPVEGEAAIEDMFPEEKSPGYLFDGTWTEMYETEDVYFRTGALGEQRGQQWGATSYIAGITGIQPDMTRSIDGGFTVGDDLGILRDGGISGIATGAFYKATSVAMARGISPGSANSFNVSFDSSRVVPTGTTGKVKNRLIKVWQKTAA